MSQSCKTCRFLDVQPDKRGRIVVRDTGYKCIVPLPAMPVFPDSVTQNYAYRSTFKNGFTSGYVVPSMGVECPLYKARVKK